jgi:hypothetical protein
VFDPLDSERIELGEDQPLIRSFRHTSPLTLEDLWTVMAHNVEVSLRQNGAWPRKDYAFTDLYRLAGPFVLEVFRRGYAGREVSFEVGWTPGDE